MLFGCKAQKTWLGLFVLFFHTLKSLKHTSTCTHSHNRLMMWSLGPWQINDLHLEQERGSTLWLLHLWQPERPVGDLKSLKKWVSTSSLNQQCSLLPSFKSTLDWRLLFTWAAFRPLCRLAQVSLVKSVICCTGGWKSVLTSCAGDQKLFHRRTGTIDCFF